MTTKTLFTSRGWEKRGRWCYGYYRTRYGSFQGKIRLRSFYAGDFYLRHPPEPLKTHEHWPCFIPGDSGWYMLHFDKKPNMVEDGIKTIEALISSAFFKVYGKE